MVVILRRDLGETGHMCAQAVHAASALVLECGPELVNRGWRNGVVVVLTVDNSAALAAALDELSLWGGLDLPLVSFHEDDGRGMTAIALLLEHGSHARVSRFVRKLPLA